MASPAAADSKDVVAITTGTGVVAKSNRMKGMKIRDEYICPITYELMREPVVARDGHTYEKSAIEKWLKTSNTSPRSGEEIDNTMIPNINLKKLIQDIINEGGAGFYTYDISNKDRLFDVMPEKVLILECLGPPESDWNQQSFQVTRFGCIGGRKHQTDERNSNKDVVLFKDITVSRRHFEITQSIEGKDKNFYIRDLGSAGGTFIRIAFGARKELHPGMIILLGKHQFTVSSIDDAVYDTDADVSSASGSGKGLCSGKSVARASLGATALPGLAGGGGGGERGSVAGRRNSLDPEAILSLVQNAERLISDISEGAAGHGRRGGGVGGSAVVGGNASRVSAAGGGRDSKQQQSETEELSSRLKDLSLALKDHIAVSAAGAGGEGGGAADPKFPSIGDLYDPAAMLEGVVVVDGDRDRDRPDGGGGDHKAAAMMGWDDSNKTMVKGALSGKAGGGGRDPAASSLLGGGGDSLQTLQQLARRCTLTCCAPDGSPLQGKSFAVGPEGAGLGRRQSNEIALFMKIVDAAGEERIMNVDTAISSEHARVEFEKETGRFFICDGTATKPSTNGTWYRLSGPHQESPPHLLMENMEILIGTVRFQARESMTISEMKVESRQTNNLLSARSPNAAPLSERK